MAWFNLYISHASFSIHFILLRNILKRADLLIKIDKLFSPIDLLPAERTARETTDGQPRRAGENPGEFHAKSWLYVLKCAVDYKQTNKNMTMSGAFCESSCQ